MDFSYKKNDNQTLFKSLEEKPDFGIQKPQNYIPLYNLFFSLSATNSNAIQLNNQWHLHKLTGQETANIFKCSVKSEKKKENKLTYLKFSPLLDPLQYLLGKYDVTDGTLMQLPAYESTASNPKTREYNNSAYVDSFFSFLSSKLLHEHHFLHGLDFYGSFLALKTDFRFNIIDDIDLLNESAFFRRNDKVLYELEEVDIDETNDETRNYRKKLKIQDGAASADETKILLNLSDITDISQIDAICNTEAELVPVELTLDNIGSHVRASSNNSSCSSRTSHTTNEDGANEGGANEGDANEGDANEDGANEGGANEDGANEGGANPLGNITLKDEESGDEDEEDDGEDSEDDDDDDDDDEVLIAKLKQFPVQVIALEKCENTLDNLITHGDITDEMWNSIVMQILFSLITFQKTFSLTHNDLHTNNIMYCETDKKFLHYKLNHIYYKVPTYGKIFKIIDFGRAIYKFRGQLLCSDSYHPKGDAATQYNCEPYFNEKKPRLEPNMSFDLCRLGCALYDYLIDEPNSKIVQIMLKWVMDDKDRNILYKKNGDERYPDFKLYKMIARTVNKHLPLDVLNNTYFDKFIIQKKELKTSMPLMDLDTIPCYV
jgi:hypothetical protein